MKNNVYDKTKATGLFFRIPKELQYYVFLPGYKAEMSYLYGIIADYYNPKYGYAFPSFATLSIDYGKAIKTTQDHINTLVKYELVRKIKTMNGNHYEPLIPLSQDELYAKYPEARELRENAKEKAEKEKQRGKENLLKHKERKKNRQDNQNDTQYRSNDTLTDEDLEWL